MGLNGLCLKHWSLEINPFNGDSIKFHVWVRLSGLPLEFMDVEVFMLMPIFKIFDKVTKFKKHLLFARVCVIARSRYSLLKSLHLPNLEFGRRKLKSRALQLFVNVVVKLVMLLLIVSA